MASDVVFGSKTLGLVTDLMKAIGVNNNMIDVYSVVFNHALISDKEFEYFPPMVLDFSEYDENVIKKLFDIGLVVYLVMTTSPTIDIPNQSVCYLSVPIADIDQSWTPEEKEYTERTIAKIRDRAMDNGFFAHVVDLSNGNSQNTSIQLEINGNMHTYLI